MTNQRKHIIDTVNTLTDADELLFGAGLNVEMSGDMQEVSETFDVGDVFTFDLSLLQSSEDESAENCESISSDVRLERASYNYSRTYRRGNRPSSTRK